MDRIYTKFRKINKLCIVLLLIQLFKEKKEFKMAEKRELEEEPTWIGPLPTEAAEKPQRKKLKVLEHEKLYLDK